MPIARIRPASSTRIWRALVLVESRCATTRMVVCAMSVITLRSARQRASPVADDGVQAVGQPGHQFAEPGAGNDVVEFVRGGRWRGHQQTRYVARLSRREMRATSPGERDHSKQRKLGADGG